MKKILLSLFSSFFISLGWSQNCDIQLVPIITPSADGSYHPQVVNFLTNRLRVLTSQSTGISGVVSNQFAIAINYDVIDKQIVAGSPTKIVYDLNLSLYILNINDEKIYASYSKDLKGIGDNETKSLINAFRKLSVDNSEVKAFVQAGKRKVVEYFDANYQNVIRTARTLSAMKDFDAAICKLMAVPECCIGYGAVLEELKHAYQSFVNQHCNENLAQAKMAWLSSPNMDGASIAGVYLSEIYPDAACYSDAMNLYKEIQKQIGEEWRFVMRQWSDNVKLEQQRIDAMREIAIAYAQSQPREITKIFWK